MRRTFQPRQRTWKIWNSDFSCHCSASLNISASRKAASNKRVTHNQNRKEDLTEIDAHIKSDPCQITCQIHLFIFPPETEYYSAKNYSYCFLSSSTSCSHSFLLRCLPRIRFVVGRRRRTSSYPQPSERSYTPKSWRTIRRHNNNTTQMDRILKLHSAFQLRCHSLEKEIDLYFAVGFAYTHDDNTYTYIV